MDYVCEVLGKQGWERCDCINDYMAGWEATPYCSDDDESKWLQKLEPKTASVGCQTPKEWLTLSPLHERKEAERRVAEQRKDAAQPGMTSPRSLLCVAFDLL